MLSEKTKLCLGCGLIKELNLFGSNKSLPTGFTAKCKACRKETEAAARLARQEADPDGFAAERRNYHYEKKYNITLEEYHEMHALQNGECAICSRTAEEAGGKGGVLVVDHNHETMEVRGLLCGRCNTGLGLLMDDAVVLTSAAKYVLERGSYSK